MTSFAGGNGEIAIRPRVKVFSKKRKPLFLFWGLVENSFPFFLRSTLTLRAVAIFVTYNLSFLKVYVYLYD